MEETYKVICKEKQTNPMHKYKPCKSQRTFCPRAKEQQKIWRFYGLIGNPQRQICFQATTWTGVRRNITHHEILLRLGRTAYERKAPLQGMYRPTRNVCYMPNRFTNIRAPQFMKILLTARLTKMGSQRRKFQMNRRNRLDLLGRAKVKQKQIPLSILKAQQLDCSDKTRVN